MGKTEIDAYQDVLQRCQRLLGQGKPNEVLAALNGAPAPVDADDEVLFAVLGAFKHLARGVGLMYRGSEKEQVLAAFRSYLEAIPDDPDYDEVRAHARGLILLQEKDVDEIPADDLEELPADLQGIARALRAINSASPHLSAAANAMRADDEATYVAEFGRARAIYEQAGAEAPPMAVQFKLLIDVADAFMSTVKQSTSLRILDFDRVTEFQAKISERTENIAARYESFEGTPFIPLGWIPQVSSVFAASAIQMAKAAALFRDLLRHQAATKHADALREIRASLQEQRATLGGLEGPDFMTPTQKGMYQILESVDDLLERLALEAKPSRQRMVSASGSLAAFVFVATAAVLLFLDQVMGADLDGNTVLGSFAFFGLVSGFGYGALRFRAFLSDFFKPGGKSD